MQFFSFIFCILFVPLIIALAYVGIKMRVSYLTSPESFDPSEYQGIVTSVLLSLVIVILIFRLRFPKSLWSDILLLSGPIGFLVGLLVGIVWQLCVGKTIPKLFRKGLLISGLLALLSAASTARNTLSMLKEQQKRINVINSFSTRDISRANIKFDRAKTLSVTDAKELKSFKGFLADAKLCAVSKKADLENLQIEIHSGGEGFAYEAAVSAERPDDVLLKFSAGQKGCWICLPGLKRWLDENVLNKGR